MIWKEQIKGQVKSPIKTLIQNIAGEKKRGCFSFSDGDSHMGGRVKKRLSFVFSLVVFHRSIEYSIWTVYLRALWCRLHSTRRRYSSVRSLGSVLFIKATKTRSWITPPWSWSDHSLKSRSRSDPCDLWSGDLWFFARLYLFSPFAKHRLLQGPDRFSIREVMIWSKSGRCSEKLRSGI